MPKTKKALNSNWFLQALDEPTREAFKKMFQEMRLPHKAPRQMRCFDGQVWLLWRCKFETIHFIKDKLDPARKLKYRVFFREANKNDRSSKKISPWPPVSRTQKTKKKKGGLNGQATS